MSVRADPVGPKNLLASHEKCLLGKNRPAQFRVTQWSVQGDGFVLFLPMWRWLFFGSELPKDTTGGQTGSYQGNSSPGGWSDPFPFLPPPSQIIKAFHEWNPRDQPVGGVNLRSGERFLPSGLCHSPQASARLRGKKWPMEARTLLPPLTELPCFGKRTFHWSAAVADPCRLLNADEYEPFLFSLCGLSP